MFKLGSKGLEGRTSFKERFKLREPELKKKRQVAKKFSLLGKERVKSEGKLR